MAEPLQERPPQDNLWVRLRRNKDFLDLFRQPVWGKKRQDLLKKIRTKGADEREADYARGFLDALDWVNQLPESESKKFEEELKRAKAKKEAEKRWTIPSSFRDAFSLRQV